MQNYLKYTKLFDMTVYCFNTDIYYSINMGYVVDNSESQHYAYALIEIEALRMVEGRLYHLTYESFGTISDRKEELLEIDKREEDYSPEMGDAIFKIIREDILEELTEWLNTLTTD